MGGGGGVGGVVGGGRFMVLNATFNNISVISWWYYAYLRASVTVSISTANLFLEIK